MHWVIQDSPYHEEGHYVLKQTLERLELPFTEVKIVPFSHEMQPDPVCTNPIIVMGSITLAKLAVERGWTPGTFTNDNFSYAAYLDFYGEHMLNNDAVICQFGRVTESVPWNEFFIRPMLDMKQFGGMTMSFAAQQHWAESVAEIEAKNYTTIDSRTMVVVAPLKDIAREYRFFIVDGKVVTGSQYKIGDRVVYNSQVDDSWDFAQKMADLWQPARAFVLDIALVDGNYKVIEVNCINSAGYYAADVSKLVQALESMGY